MYSGVVSGTVLGEGAVVDVRVVSGVGVRESSGVFWLLSEQDTSSAEQITPASRGQAIFMKEFLIISLP